MNRKYLRRAVEIKVPKKLIKEFHDHPEYDHEGAHIVYLINGMYTDVFLNEEGYYTTVTNDKNLFKYLKKNTPKEERVKIKRFKPNY